jgi:hypothetical protein
MRIANTGNVGIGTTTPSAKLEVNVGLNSLKISGRDTYVDSTEDPTNANIYVTQAGVGDFSQLAGNLVLQARTQGTVYRDIIFAGGLSNGDALMTILGEGNVGIGTSNPGEKLEVYGSATATSNFTGLKLTNGADGGLKILFSNNVSPELASIVAGVTSAGAGTDDGTLIFSTAANAVSSERMRITKDGYVGIGTTNPVTNLEVSGSIGATGLRYSSSPAKQGVYLGNSAATPGTTDYATIEMCGGATGGCEIDFTKPGFDFRGRIGYDMSTDYMWFVTAADERMRITSGGFLKASNNGTYNGSTGTYHEFNSSINNNQIGTFTNYSSSPYGIEVNFGSADPNNATNWGLGFYTSSPSFVWIYRIFSNGTISARSDARWKKNIETTRNGYLEDLCKLRVVKYNWYNHEEDAPKELGLIAQEVEEVFPNLVQYDKVTTKKQVEQEDGTFIEQEVEDGESRSIKTSVLPYMLLKALQEANAKIDELKAEVEQLKQK